MFFFYVIPWLLYYPLQYCSYINCIFQVDFFGFSNRRYLGVPIYYYTIENGEFKGTPNFLKSFIFLWNSLITHPVHEIDRYYFKWMWCILYTLDQYYVAPLVVVLTIYNIILFKCTSVGIYYNYWGAFRVG